MHYINSEFFQLFLSKKIQIILELLVVNEIDYIYYQYTTI